jgi:hypothetical protein
MLAVAGTYQNGFVKLDEAYSSEKPIKVIVTFMEDSFADAELRSALPDNKILPPPLKYGSAKHLIAYIADDFNAPINDFNDYI